MKLNHNIKAGEKKAHRRAVDQGSRIVCDLSSKISLFFVDVTLHSLSVFHYSFFLCVMLFVARPRHNDNAQEEKKGKQSSVKKKERGSEQPKTEDYLRMKSLSLN